jgi:hypothetical protein
MPAISPQARADSDRRPIDVPNLKRDLVVTHAAPHERIRCVDDRVAQRVVGTARDGQKTPFGRRAGVERRDDRVRPADEREPREGPFRAEDAREQRLVARAGRIVVAIAEGSREIVFGDAFVEERAEHVGAYERPRLRARIRIDARDRAARGGGDTRIDRKALDERFERCDHAALSASWPARFSSARS